MIKSFNLSGLLLLLNLFSVSLFGQQRIEAITGSSPLRYGHNGANELPVRHTVIDLGNLRALGLAFAEAERESILSMPILHLGEKTFRLRATTAMHPALARKYPDIKTFAGYNPEQPSEMISLTFSDSGVWGTVQALDGNYYIEPNRNDANQAILFAAKDDPRKPQTIGEKHWCGVEEEASGVMVEPTPTTHGNRMAPGDAFRPTGDNLLIYRSAMIMGAEATQSIAGGNKPVALAWLANLVNTSNNVLIRDIGLKLELIANNDAIIFTSASTLPLPSQPYNPALYPAGMQPFPSPPYDPTTTLLSYCMPVLDAYIGAANYDAGYLHNNGIGGGWAFVDALHSTLKGRGIGNPDYEIFIHEFGHMGGSGHNITTEGGLRTTFGGTIMGSRSNTRSASGDQFSSHTIDRFTIGCYGPNSNASQNISSGNTIPSITVPAGGFSIPFGTPFKLTAVGSDPDPGQTLTYTWEQNDTSNVTFSLPNFPPTTGPLFWSVFPTTDGATRYFPDLSYLTTNTNVPGETLPFQGRVLNFRAIVRDNFATCGGLNFKNVRFNVYGNAGPFEVTWFNNSGNVITGNTTQTVTWAVNNTNNAPVSCSSVRILLSHDGGFTYPDVIATVPNNGSANVLFPNIPGNQKRIMIEAVGNHFFDINNANFQIADANVAGLNSQISATEKVIHTQTTTSIDLSTQKLGSFVGTVTITLSGVPAGASATFPNGQNTITLTPSFTTTLTFSGLQSVARGRYPITITSTGGAIINTNVFNLIKTGVAETTPGNAISFNGSSYANNPNFSIPSSQVSYTAWVKRNNVPNTDLEMLFFFPNSPVTGSLPGFYLNGPNGELRYHEKWWNGSGLIVNNEEWTFVAVVVTPAKATIYKNGVPSIINLDNNSQMPFSGGINMGTQTPSWRRFNGLIEEARFWNRALTTQEIRELMHLSSPASAADAGLFSYYQFNQASGNAVDVIRSYDLTLLSGTGYNASQAAIGTGVVTTQTINVAGNATFNSPVNAGLDINFGTAPAGDIVVTKLDNASPHGPSVPITNTPNYWIVNNYGTVNTGLNAQMTFSIPTNWMSPNIADYKLYKRASTSTGAWDTPIDANLVDIPNHKVRFPGIQSFSQFIVSASSLLPIELLEFTAELKQPSTALLQWTSVTEYNSAWYHVQRSRDGHTFETIGKVKAQGFSLANVAYSFEDPSLKEGTYFYRLEMEDLDGSTAFSPIASIQIQGKTTLALFPNPNKGQFTIQLPNNWASVEVYNSLGQWVEQRKAKALSTPTLDITLDTPIAGTYLVSVIMEDGSTLTQMMLVQ